MLTLTIQNACIHKVHLKNHRTRINDIKKIVFATIHTLAASVQYNTGSQRLRGSTPFEPHWKWNSFSVMINTRQIAATCMSESDVPHRWRLETHVFA